MSFTSSEPLAARMRPRTLEEVAGQEHILGPGKLLRRVIEADRLTNIILFGPPGCGKTTLAEVIARTTQRKFVRCSGVVSNVADIRQVCDRARNELGGMGTILFIDEIHRFNKAQQDVLLPYVEGATARCPRPSTPMRGSFSPKSATATDATRSPPSRSRCVPRPPRPTA